MQTSALVSAVSLELLEEPALPAAQLHELWRTFGSVQAGWQRAIRASDPPSLTRLTAAIFAAESLTRVWGAVLAARDDFRRTAETASLGRYLLVGHRELSRRAFQAVLAGRGGDTEPLWQFQHRVARWTDLMLGHLVVRHPVAEYAFVTERAIDFGADFLQCRGEGRLPATWNLRLAALSQASPPFGADATADGAWLACQRAIVACIPSHLGPAAPPALRELLSPPAPAMNPLIAGRRIRFSRPA